MGTMNPQDLQSYWIRVTPEQESVNEIFWGVNKHFLVTNMTTENGLIQYIDVGSRDRAIAIKESRTTLSFRDLYRDVS